jgi:cullin 1
MGYEKKIALKKIDSEILWTGEKNLILYDREFEKPLKEATQKFFEKKAKIWSEDNSCHEYILKVAEHLKKEEQNCDLMLQYETKSKIVTIIETELIQKKAEMVIMKETTGCKFMFNERKVE